jgi:hypothetical protein
MSFIYGGKIYNTSILGLSPNTFNSTPLRIYPYPEQGNLDYKDPSIQEFLKSLSCLDCSDTPLSSGIIISCVDDPEEDNGDGGENGGGEENGGGGQETYDSCPEGYVLDDNTYNSWDQGAYSQETACLAQDCEYGCVAIDVLGTFWDTKCCVPE